MPTWPGSPTPSHVVGGGPPSPAISSIRTQTTHVGDSFQQRIPRPLIETATKLGFELCKAEGRKEALEEVRQGMSLGEDWQIEDPRISYVEVQVDKDLYQTVHGPSQPQEATSEPLTAQTTPPRTPEAEQPGSMRIPGGEG